MGCGTSARQESKDGSEVSLGHEFRGLSVNYLTTTLFDELRKVRCSIDDTVQECEPKLIRPKGANVVCPRDGKLGAAFVDCVHGTDYVGVSTFMLSYTWRYKVSDISNALSAFCEHNRLDAKRLYIWICCFCINQHRVRELRTRGVTVPFDEFRDAFSKRVNGIGRMITMMSPWHNPAYLSRVWCIFEMFTALTGQHEVVIVMPPSETHALAEALRGGGADLEVVWNALSSVNIEKAEAFAPEDKERIMAMLKSRLAEP